MGSARSCIHSERPPPALRQVSWRAIGGRSQSAKPCRQGTPTAGVNLGTAQALFGFPWVMTEASYDALTADYDARIPATLGPGNVIMTGAWTPTYEHLGDGLHPTIDASELGALRIVLAIKQFENP